MSRLNHPRRNHATGEVEAEFCFTHVGHKQENAYNRISKEMRTTIAGKLSQGVSMNSVMDYVRDSMCRPINRDHLITRADLHNIKRQYNINCMEKASDDTDSVLYWVKEMECEEFNLVLRFKQQGEKSSYNCVEEKDFLFGFQTQFQKEMFETHGNKLICVDATHGTSAYDFQLVTVLVLDDHNEGIPVQWLISNKETTNVLKIFFSSLRERCGDMPTEIFMTDDAEAYYNAWISAFSRPDRKLLCSWHVGRSWRQKLNEHLKDKEKMAEVYAALKSLQNDLSETSFRRSLQQFMAWIKTISEPLAKYFEKEYVGRTRE